jgi:lipopolysaccharide/colanic/teichoic acid biosynthesis glycosyltransferase
MEKIKRFINLIMAVFALIYLCISFLVVYAWSGFDSAADYLEKNKKLIDKLEL